MTAIGTDISPVGQNPSGTGVAPATTDLPVIPMPSAQPAQPLGNRVVPIVEEVTVQPGSVVRPGLTTATVRVDASSEEGTDDKSSVHEEGGDIEEYSEDGIGLSSSAKTEVPQDDSKSLPTNIAKIAFGVFGSIVVGALSLGIGYLSLSFIVTDFVPSILPYSGTAIKALSSVQALFITYKLLPMKRSTGLLAKVISMIALPVIAAVVFGTVYFSFGMLALHFIPLYAETTIFRIALGLISWVGAVVLAQRFCSVKKAES